MAKQIFRFAKLYKDNRKAVVNTLTSMWCSEAKDASQDATTKELSGIIANIFTPENAQPLVQCMNNYEEVNTVTPAEAETLVGNLWRKTMPEGKYYPPYEHQYQCWHTLLREKSGDGKPMSIVVKTGTGSGKTECFMLPLVRDLLDHPIDGQVQAIFLYPLNALMEDQKARLEKILEGTNLTYAVYNGDLPEKVLPANAHDYQKVLRKIDEIKGIERDGQGNIIKCKYQHAVGTREELRKHPANILLTNPTMLEYILLRDKDQTLIQPDKHSLRWIAIDETHTYTGAGATEIAMLLRRVLMAYDVTTDTVRFATSSATIGGNDGGNPDEELRQFIAGITGLEERQVRVVDGKRKGIEKIPHDEDEKYWKRLINANTDGYIPLDKLFDGQETIEENLEHLDRMCQKAEDKNLTDLRVKVHYFYHVPNQGLFVDVSQYANGAFKIYTENRTDSGENGGTPLLEMSRCKHCGEYIAVAETNGTGDRFQPITMDDNDMFDLEVTEETKKNFVVFGLSDKETSIGDGNVPYDIQGNKLIPGGMSPEYRDTKWHVIGNHNCCCPHCGTKLTKTPKSEEANPDGVLNSEEDRKKLQKFRVPADFISRLIAPSTLDLMTKQKPKDERKLAMHDGQQYISFVDSRQNAARATIKQNLEEERLWVYSVIFHELCRRSANSHPSKEEAMAMMKKVIDDPSVDLQRKMSALTAIQALQSTDGRIVDEELEHLTLKSVLSWNDIAALLNADKYFDKFCLQFAERSELSKELDENGNLTSDLKKKYTQSLMVEYLSKRPLSAAAPETMGLFTSYYEKLESAYTDDLPDAVKAFNGQVSESSQISKKDWHDLMQVFLDFTVRSNESVFLHLPDDEKTDIFRTVRFATEKERRRPVRKPQVMDKGSNQSRIVRMIASLIACDRHIQTQDAIRGYKTLIQSVIDAMWTCLTSKYKLLVHSTHYDEEEGVQIKDRDEVIDDVHYIPYRLNLVDLSFKLYDDVWLCDTNVSKDSQHVARLRPVETLFKGFSPYMIGGEPVVVDEELHEKWESYPYYKGSADEFPSLEKLHGWASANRKLLFDHSLWSQYGVFSIRLDEIYRYPKLFLQAEHTAQVDKMISRKVQADFKDHCLNILACSTTMEMGVDLGDLELVMLDSVPPRPANYKQRAGRSGRRGQVRSACVTLCGSDVLGIRTLRDPLGTLIMKKVASPMVDLNSGQVIQRHVDSFLVREFGVFGMGENGGSITQQVINYYTNYFLDTDGASKHVTIKKKVGNAPVGPGDGLGDPTGTPFETFNELCSKPLSASLRKKLTKLLDGTIFAGKEKVVVNNARKLNEKCYCDLEMRVRDLKEAYNAAKSAKQRAFFMLKFIEPLAARLLSFWATHRFIPNANMPVNVVEFDINSATQTSYTAVTPSNPSYPLRTALSQYAPGNPIARDGIVRIVRGIRYTDFFKPTVTFKKLYRNKEQAVIDAKNEIDNLLPWSVSETTDLDMLQPTEFIPDMNESPSRILDKTTYTKVSAQLIGTDEWCPDRTEPHLFDARSSRESGNGQILYYNEGTGFGYCHCTKCGRTVLESWAAASASDPDKLPDEMNPVQSKDPEKPNFHFSLMKKNGKAVHCMGCNSPEYIKRNVVLGDTIPTDYTEIRIRHIDKDWLKSRKDNVGLLTTLGLVFTQALSEELSVLRDDLDFTVTPNGHICIFDTNPGGSGYSNQLAGMDLLKIVIRRARTMIESAQASKSKETLIDKSTMRYINYIDIDAAKAWLDEELSAQKVLPKNIADVFPNATETSLVKLERTFATSLHDAVLFVDDNFNKWNYDDQEHGWRPQLLSYFYPRGMQTSFCVCRNKGYEMTEPIYAMVRNAKAWTKNQEFLVMDNPFTKNGIYPIAYIEGYLYFSNNPLHTTLDDNWGGGTLYYVKAKNPALDAEVLVEEQKPATKLIIMSGNDYLNIHTDELGGILSKLSGGIIEDFITECKQAGKKLEISYQDEHLKSILGMVFTLQTIGWFVKSVGNDFTLHFLLEKYIDHGYKDKFNTNLPTAHDRDEWLTKIAGKWMKDTNSAAGGKYTGQLIPVESLDRGTLPHWRVLTIKCSDKTLNIYPDGGFMNGWNFKPEHKPGVPYKYYEVGNTTTDDVLTLERVQDIKFDVVVK